MDLKSIFSVFVICSFVTMYQVSSLRISAFNIQIFGESKVAKADVMDILVQIISRYDIVLILEVRDSKGTAIEKLLDQVNTKSSENPFSMKISERLGRTISKEQYAFFYRKGAGLKVIDDYTYNDESYDQFEREPYVVLFESSNTVLKRFAIAGVHIKPDDAVKEIQALEEVFADVKSRLSVDDVMVMGDMNADCSYVRKNEWREIQLRENKNYRWLIDDDEDTTVSGTDCAYDRFIVTGDGFKSSSDGGLVKNSVKVLKFDELYDLSSEQARAVSDHYPIELELKVEYTKQRDTKQRDEF